jgi:hypothetical protein
MMIKRLSQICLALGAATVCILGASWYRCQTKYHYFEWRLGKEAAVTVESYSNGFYVGVGTDRSPFLEGNAMLWNTFDYPDGKIPLQPFRFELGYPFGASSESTSARLSYWALIVGCLIFLLPSIVVRRMEIAQQAGASDGDKPPS